MICTVFLSCFSFSSIADINVFACEPEWQSLVIELGGSKVSSFSATTGLQDPHQIQARPSLINKMRNADLLVCSGADLEVGWLPVLLRRASNQKLQPNKPSYFFAANFVKLLGIPKLIDRSQGDVHAAGNPHIQTNPKNITLVTKALVKRMKKIDPKNATFYQTKADDFLMRWKKSIKKWRKQIRSIKGKGIVVQHASWDYLLDFTKMEQIATIEEKPGIPATSGHLTSLISGLKNSSTKIIIRAAYQDDHASKWLAQRSGLTALELPFTVGGSPEANDLFSLFDQTFSLIVSAIDDSDVQEID